MGKCSGAREDMDHHWHHKHYSSTLLMPMDCISSTMLFQAEETLHRHDPAALSHDNWRRSGT